MTLGLTFKAPSNHTVQLCTQIKSERKRICNPDLHAWLLSERVHVPTATFVGTYGTALMQALLSPSPEWTLSTEPFVVTSFIRPADDDRLLAADAASY
jgi:hypothetical protein